MRARAGGVFGKLGSLHQTVVLHTRKFKFYTSLVENVHFTTGWCNWYQNQKIGLGARTRRGVRLHQTVVLYTRKFEFYTSLVENVHFTPAW